jgi:hypothetical protein
MAPLKRAMGEPALQVMAALVAGVVFTWPLLVFDRASSVFAGFFCSWPVVIALLYAFSRVPSSESVDAESLPESHRDA